ncbi:MAG: hypothetical protein MZV70_42695 [Desulfobacterales bacterium]|nr:hypothetical protein [Desulfobacterales bacterium]
MGWYEAGWGPMMSETAFFVKDVVGPNGCVSIVAKQAGGEKKSSDIDAHTKTESLLLHHAALKAGRHVREARRGHRPGGRAGPPGAVRARAAVLPPRDHRGPRPRRTTWATP